MCMEDVRLGRQSHAQEIKCIVTTTSALILPYDPHRIALVISCPTGSNVHLSFGPVAVSGGGMVLGQLGTPIVLNIQQHGDIVRRAIYAVSDNTTATFMIWAATLAKE